MNRKCSLKDQMENTIKIPKNSEKTNACNNQKNQKFWENNIFYKLKGYK